MEEDLIKRQALKQLSKVLTPEQLITVEETFVVEFKYAEQDERE